MTQQAEALQIGTAGPFGGDGGTPWDDYKAIPGIIRIVAFTVRSGNRLDALQVVYQTTNGNEMAPKHGGGGGSAVSVGLQQDEKVIGAGIRSGNSVDDLSIVTLTREGAVRNYGPYGGTHGIQHMVTGNIIAFFGRAGGRIDALGFYGYGLRSNYAPMTLDEFIARATEAAAAR